MSYCTQEDLLKLIPEPELTQLTAEIGDDPDAGVVAEAIAAAEAEIDSYLAVRYQLPLEMPIPARVKSLAVDMAIAKLYARRSNVPEDRRQAYEDAVKFLKDAAAGRAVIIGAAGLEEPGAVQDVAEISSSPRVFDRGKLRGF